MKVKELVEQLSKYNPDDVVLVEQGDKASPLVYTSHKSYKKEANWEEGWQEYTDSMRKTIKEIEAIQKKGADES